MSGISDRTLKMLAMVQGIQNRPVHATSDPIQQENEMASLENPSFKDTTKIIHVEPLAGNINSPAPQMPTSSDKSDLLFVEDPENSINQDRSPNVLTFLESPAINQDINCNIRNFEAQQEIGHKNLLAPNTRMPFYNYGPSLAGDRVNSITYQSCSTNNLTPLKNVAFDDSLEGNNKTNCLKLPEIENEFIAQRATTSSYKNSRPLFDLDSDDSLKDPNYSNEESSQGSESKSSADEEEEEYNIEEAEENNEDKEGGEHHNENNRSIRQSRKRTRNTVNWKCNIRKQKRRCGEEYISKKNVKVKARKIRPPCQETCPRKCFQKISPDIRNTIFREFWSSSRDINQKRQFIASSVETSNVQKRRSRTDQKARNTTNQYFFSIENEKIRVCKTFFLHTLDISQSFVNVALSKKLHGGIVSEDKRGKKIPPNKLDDRVRDGVRTHICKFPVVESHYSRERSRKKYLGNDLNITRMFELYKQECTENKIPEEFIAKKWLYEQIFNTEFNYGFKLPDNDTCDVCDEFLIKLQDSDPSQRPTIQQEYDQHLMNAKERYHLKKEDKNNARLCRNTKVIMVDLEKCLPTPMLTNAQSFYSLKLWTFNYTIRDSTRNKTYCCMWDETVGGRGGNEMASCLLKWALTNISSDIEVLTIWSDNCVSQNRNINAVLAYFFILKCIPTLKIINHKYLLRGHTHLEVDCDHSVIEREKKKVPQFKIMTPWDWQQLVRIASRSNPFTVINMDIEDFKNFKTLMEGTTAPFVSRKKTSNNEDLKISEVVHMQVRSDDMGVLYFKTDFASAEFMKVDFNRSSRRAEFPNEVPLVRKTSKPISTKKFQHLQKLLQWVPRVFHAFYANIAHQDNIKDE